jgi:hypothetical protein
MYGDLKIMGNIAATVSKIMEQKGFFRWVTISA